MGKEDTEIQVLLQKLDSKIDKVDSKIDKISSEIQSEIDKVQTKLMIKLSSVVFICVGIAFVVNAWFFDYKFDFTNDEHKARFDRLESNVFVSRNEQLVNLIQKLQSQIENSNISDKNNKKKKR